MPSCLDIHSFETLDLTQNFSRRLGKAVLVLVKLNGFGQNYPFRLPSGLLTKTKT
jgi:hypothetical protein